jgi:adenylosuccinate synthase
LENTFVVNQRKSAVILGAQWGDEGKGKIVDVLSEKFSVVARYAGGHNAGHTVIIHGKKFVLQLIPCGVLRPECKGVIGNGVVLDPMAFLNEVKKLKDAGLRVDGQLFVSNRAQVILPYHRMIELAAENAPGRTKIGTTSRGIGPAYEDKMHRSGLRVVDLLNSALLRTHIENACHEKNTIAHALFGTEPLDPKTMYEEYSRAAEQIAPFVTDTAESCARQRREGDVRRGAGGAARYRPWDLSVCDFIVFDCGWSGDRDWRWANADWHGYRRDEGLCDPGWRGAFSD